MSNTTKTTPSERLRADLDEWGNSTRIPVRTDDLRAALDALDNGSPLIEWAVEQQAHNRIIGAIDTNTGQFVLYRPARPE